jgi:hypothetical protein
MDHPIACRLTPIDYRRRTDELTAIATGALRSREPIHGGQRLVFSGSPETEQDLRDALAAEATCCPFLEMHLTRTPDGLVLDITGPKDAQSVIGELFGSAPRAGAWR